MVTPGVSLVVPTVAVVSGVGWTERERRLPDAPVCAVHHRRLSLCASAEARTWTAGGLGTDFLLITRDRRGVGG
jgi:hypothetical protein